MKYIILLAALLSGCASMGVETVKIPVAVACKAEDPVPPSYRFAPPYDNIFDAVRDLMGDRELSTAYETELKAALKSCK